MNIVQKQVCLHDLFYARKTNLTKKLWESQPLNIYSERTKSNFQKIKRIFSGKKINFKSLSSCLLKHGVFEFDVQFIKLCKECFHLFLLHRSLKTLRQETFGINFCLILCIESICKLEGLRHEMKA